jgi:hypothetical protein
MVNILLKNAKIAPIKSPVAWVATGLIKKGFNSISRSA